MNWGTKIVIGMLCFMSFIIVLAVQMFRSDTDALVDQDYYEKGLKYDEVYRQKENVINDGAKPLVAIGDSAIGIAFKSSASGNIRMMRVADKSMDRELKFSTDPDNKTSLSRNGFAEGRWKIIIRWTTPAGVSYLNEQEIYMP